MEITGSQRIAAPRPAVWRALNDPAVLKACLPGCESVEKTSPERFKVVMTAAVGPLKARFAGTLELTEADPPNSCLMVFEGQGGAMGFGKGTAQVALRDADGGTDLEYTAKAQVGGKLAQVGGRLLDSVARKMSDDFFQAFFRQQLTAPADAPGVPATAPVSAMVATRVLPKMRADGQDSHARAPPPSRSVPVWVWIALAAAAGMGIGIGIGLLF